LVGAVPEAIIARFRSVGLERLEQIESIWLTITQGPANVEAGAELLRLLHTLKGDARIVGFVDVHFLCHKLEGLCAYAHRQGYRVTEDFDLIVTMGVRFLAMLLRKKAGRSLGGIDLPGFARQIDEALLDAQLADHLVEDRRGSPTAPLPPRAPSIDRLSEATLHRLGAAATSVYLERLCSEDRRATRLAHAWNELSSQLESLASVPLRGRVGRHAGAVTQLARDLGREVDVSFELGDVRVSDETAQALDLVVLHCTRNAVDHGIEEPLARTAAGKHPRATLRVQATRSRDRIELSISDDGRGVDREAIRRRAVDRGLMSEARAHGAADDELLTLLFAPDFSTREIVGAVSGRGVGLDAVKTAVGELGGDVRIVSERGAGTTIVVDVPHRGSQVEAQVFESSRKGILLGVPADWTVVRHHGPEPWVDPLELLDVPTAHDAGALVLSLRRGNEVHLVRAGGAPRSRTVERRCPTDESEPVEIVSAQGSDVLLLRPEVLFALEAAAGS
jgi:two-component system chemotaxis sensor kinase CheA